MNVLDSAIGFFSPTWGLRRAHARKVLRTYQGAEGNRLTGSKRPRNQAADSELLGPAGADAARAWARSFVRDNAYANGVVETIATAVVGCGIYAQSMVEDENGDDIELLNDARDKVWNEWCEACDINGELNFAEIQFLALREIVEAGEVLIRMIPVGLTQGGINRPVPLALEMIDADRLALDRDTWAYRETGNRVIRGIEMDERGKPLAYWIYPEHPNSPYIARNTTPDRIPASEILHLYRKDRVGQTRGVSWFAPVLNPIRDLGVYIDNELQASAVSSCFAAVIKTDGTAGQGLLPTDGSDTSDGMGNDFEFLEPGLVARLRPGESIESVNPGRPNSAAEPWINLMVRNIGVGVGLGYEKVSRDYSRTTYSSARTAELEDRRRFKRFQRFIIAHLCQPVWDRFCEQAATVNKLTNSDTFPALSDLLDDRRALTPVTWQVPEWEWVDPQNEQAAAVSAIQNNMSTLQRECGKLGINWREVLRQRHKEREAEQEYEVQPLETQQAEANILATTANVGSGSLKGMGRLDFKNTQKAIDDVLFGVENGTRTETQARVMLSGLGLSDAEVTALLADLADDGLVNGSVQA